MMAQAGATFKQRAAQPLHNPAAPSFLKMFHRKRGIDRSSGGKVPPDLFVAIEDEEESPEYCVTCCLVFPTSNGVVMIAAMPPDIAPARKLSTKVVVLVSRLRDRDLVRDRPSAGMVPFLRPRASLKVL